MLDKLRDCLDSKFDKYMPKLDNGEWKYSGSFGYYAINIIYTIIQIILFILFGKIFNTYMFIIVGTIVYNSIMLFSYAFHCHSLDHCIIITQILFIIFGVLSNIMPIWIVFILCLYSIRDIYQKSPLELNNDFKDKDEDWHFKRVVILMVVYLIASLLCYYFHLYEICKCIMLSLVMVDLMLFKNNKLYI